ncbi:MAG TPA: hypothetical protein VJ464_20860 [Blastocatellia bacterium]|nr:hypothetical protein [Blastocatellia bacterium]
MQTNDPKHRIIKVTMAATVKPLPAFVNRLSNADIEHGEQVGAFIVWPAARPIIPLEAGERLPLLLRIRPAQPGQSVNLTTTGDGYKLSRESHGDGYLLEVTAEPSANAASRVLPLVVKVEGGEELKLQVTTRTQAENLVTTPRQVDFGEVSFAKLQAGGTLFSRLGIRKQVGSFQIKSLKSSLEFLQVDSQTIVDGSNYLIRLRLDPTRLPKPATYIGTLHIETTDTTRPQLDVPIKLVVTP